MKSFISIFEQPKFMPEGQILIMASLILVLGIIVTYILKLKGKEKSVRSKVLFGSIAIAIAVAVVPMLFAGIGKIPITMNLYSWHIVFMYILISFLVISTTIILMIFEVILIEEYIGKFLERILKALGRIVSKLINYLIG